MNKQDSILNLTSNLRYERISPADLKFTDADPDWTQSAANIDESILALLDEEWFVAHIRSELVRLNFQPQERDRYALGAQLVSEFVKPERIKSCLSAISDGVYQYFLHLLLVQSLEYKFTTPSSLEKIFPLPLSANLVNKNILDAGLAIRAESGKLYFPEATLRALPRSNIVFPVVPEPDEYVSAKTPRDILLEIQQIIGLFDGQTFTLRDRLRWNPSDHVYYSQMHCWPPHPDDAKRMISEFSKIRKVSLLPPEPQLDEQALRFWADSLDIPTDVAELHYHLLVQSGILHAGSPVRINQTLVQKWLALPPGRQITILYDLYRSFSTWAVWWSIWRSGQIDVQWDYQGYHGLVYVDAAILSTNKNLQGVLLDVLSFLPQNEWLSVDAVIDWIVAVFPNAVSHRYNRGLTIANVTGGWRGWLRLVLEHTLGGPLHYIGFADVAPSINSVDLFRLHHLQDVHWGRVTDLDIGEMGSVDLNSLHLDVASQAMQITIPVHPDFLSMIQLWSNLQGLKGRKLHYSLDVECLHQAFEQGYTPLHLGEAWEKCSGFAPPKDLQSWWNHWWQNYGQIRLYPPQAILMTRDDFTMKEVQLAIPHLTDSIQSMVTPTTALIKPEDADQVLEDLQRQGYMPKKVS